jgi:hypothetical protein
VIESSYEFFGRRGRDFTTPGGVVNFHGAFNFIGDRFVFLFTDERHVSRSYDLSHSIVCDTLLKVNFSPPYKKVVFGFPNISFHLSSSSLRYSSCSKLRRFVLKLPFR